MLDKVGCDFSEEEGKLFFSIVNHDQVPLQSAERILIKIIDRNCTSKYLNQKALNAYIGKTYWRIVKYNVLNGNNNLQHFFKSPLRKYVRISPLSYIKFVLKNIGFLKHFN